MKLYDVPRNTKVRVLGEIKVPPGAPAINIGDIIFFGHIDGMYSYCHDYTGKGGTLGNLVHLVAWAEVEIVKSPAEQL